MSLEVQISSLFLNCQIESDGDVWCEGLHEASFHGVFKPHRNSSIALKQVPDLPSVRNLTQFEFLSLLSGCLFFLPVGADVAGCWVWLTQVNRVHMV